MAISSTDELARAAQQSLSQALARMDQVSRGMRKTTARAFLDEAKRQADSEVLLCVPPELAHYWLGVFGLTEASWVGSGATFLRMCTSHTKIVLVRFSDRAMVSSWIEETRLVNRIEFIYLPEASELDWLEVQNLIDRKTRHQDVIDRWPVIAEDA